MTQAKPTIARPGTWVWLAVLGFTAIAAAPVRAAEVEVSISSREAYVGVPITASITIRNAATHETPILPDIPGTRVRSMGIPSRRSQTTIINGHRTQSTSITYAWQITPHKDGRFVIPSFQVSADGQTTLTQSIEFVANKSESGDLIDAAIQGHKDAIYVGQSLTLTLRIWLKPYADTARGVKLSEANMWSFVSLDQSGWGVFEDRIKELTQRRQYPRGQEVLREDGRGIPRSYYQYDIQTTIYPKHPGQVDTGAVQIVAAYPTGLVRSRDIFSRGSLAIQGVRPIVAEAKAEAIQVKPIPTATRPPGYRGAVGQYTIQTQAIPTRVNVGDPITLHIAIRGNGPMDLVQAPPLESLEALTRHFKIPTEPLAGVVQEGVKLFTVSIRPIHERVTQIPSIPLVYFDPASEQFVTARSEPIPIKVDPAQQLDMNSIVSSAGPGHPGGLLPQPSDQEKPEQPILFANFVGHDLLSSTQPPSVQPLLWGLLLPPIVYVILFAQRSRRRADTHGKSRSAKSPKQAKKTLRAAKDLSDITAALLNYVADRLDLPRGTLTRAEAVAQLRAHGADTGLEEFDRLLARCECSRYAGQKPENPEALSTAGIQCIDQLASHRWGIPQAHKEPVATAGTRLPPMGSLRFLLAAALAWGVAAPYAGAIDLTPQQMTQLLEEADAAYNQGMRLRVTNMTDPEPFFANAARKFQLIVDQGVINGKLYFNLGNAYLHNHQMGRALANYYRASALMPSDQRVRSHLTHARSLLKPTLSATENGIWKKLSRWNRSVPPHTRAWVGLAAWAIAWAGLIGALYNQRFGWRYVAIPAMTVAAFSAASIGLDGIPWAGQDQGVIINDQVILRQGNGAGFAPKYDQALPEGAVFTVVEQKNQWLHVRLADGRTGWVPLRDAELIHSQAWRWRIGSATNRGPSAQQLLFHPSTAPV